jgi:uncharacterized protein YukE
MIVDYEQYRNAQKHLQTSQHCVSACFAVQWFSVQEHLQGFCQGAGFKNFFSLVQPFISNIEEMQHYAMTEVTGCLKPVMFESDSKSATRVISGELF